MCILLLNCSLIYQTVRIEVPKDYVGWVFVIPVKDTSGLQINKHSGRYKINQNGIAYVPTQVLNLKNDSRVLVYEENEDISNEMRYTGSVFSVKENNKKYEYIHFYLPSMNERKIDAASQYWRDKSWEYKSPFDSLLKVGKIEFK